MLPPLVFTSVYIATSVDITIIEVFIEIGGMKMLLHIGAGSIMRPCRAYKGNCPYGGPVSRTAFVKPTADVSPVTQAERKFGANLPVAKAGEVSATPVKKVKVDRKKATPLSPELLQAVSKKVAATDDSEYGRLLESKRAEIETLKEKIVLDNEEGRKPGYAATLKPWYLDGEIDGVTRGENMDTLLELGDTVNELIQVKTKSIDPEVVKDINSKISAYKKVSEELKEAEAKWRGADYSLSSEDREALLEKVREKREEKKIVEKEMDGFEELYASSYGAATKSVLEDLGVEFNSEDDAKALIDGNTRYTSTLAKKPAEEALQYLPKTFVKEVNFDVYKKGDTRRRLGYVRYNKNGIEELVTDGALSTTVHEFTHIGEMQNKEIGRLEKDLMVKVKGKSALKDSAYGGKAFTDTFLTDYSGNYESRYRSNEGSLADGSVRGKCYEIMTTGMEGLFTPDHPDRSFQFSPRKPTVHRNFVLGTIIKMAS